MNIKIIDSWLREYIDTPSKPDEIAKELSLASVSVEKTEKIGDETVYDIEVTTNRADLMSVRALANETAAVLSIEGKTAKFKDKIFPDVENPEISFPLEIVNDSKLVNRILAVVMEVEIGKSPKEISQRLELSGIRSLNNVIDVTNYVMREIGHPAHVFDFDLLGKKMVIRQSREGEELTTLDGKKYKLTGGDIVAINSEGEIIDLLGVMGTANSVVQDNTKRILFFLDNNNPRLIRQTSMNLGIRTEAAIINEKGIDPELMELAFKRGVELFKKIANGKVISKTLDIYPNKPGKNKVKVNLEQINNLIGIEIPVTKSEEILKKLGFDVKKEGEYLEVVVPTTRSAEVTIPEDVIEEIARVYGYHKLPSIVPSFQNDKKISYLNEFFIEDRIKNAMKYWGFTEVYTYSLVSEDMFDGPITSALKLKNPLTNDMEYMRNSLVPSLLNVISENKKQDSIKIFEIANTYHKRENDLPRELMYFSGAIKKSGADFFEIKGLIEQVLIDLGIKNYKFKERETPGAEVFLRNEKLGYIEILNNNIIDFELEMSIIYKNSSLRKIYKPLAKFPGITHDITFVLDENIKTEEVIEEITLQSFLIREVTLKDQFENPAMPAGWSKTFHIVYQSEDRNLTNTEAGEIKEQIIKAIASKFKASVK